MKASIKKSPSPKFYALAQLGEEKWDITGLVRRKFKCWAGNTGKYQPK